MELVTKSDKKLVIRATAFATDSHRGQVRKYTGEPYIIHPLEVSKLVASVTDDQEMIAAAVLHDVVEDCDVDIHEIRELFGFTVCVLVNDLTDISVLEDGNRATRKAIERRHAERSDPRAQTIKLADLICNTRSIVEHDPGFAKVYMAEKKALLEVLTQGNQILYNFATIQVGLYFKKHG